MANILNSPALQSSACKQTTAPQFYTDYLSNLATKGTQAAEGAKYVGATPLQQQAFQTAGANAGKYQPAFQTGLGVLGCAATKDVSGAAAPYLTAAMEMNPGQVAQCYMSPYLKNAVQNVSDIGNQNIERNLDPMATAGLVGSGQFGSQRGAQVLGQVRQNALQDLNKQIGCMTNQAYGSALQAAGQRGSLLGQLASTAGTAASQCAQTKTQAGLGYGTLGTAGSQQNIACIDALANLGAQCQTIQQNAECFALSRYGKLAGLLQGAQIPTGVRTTSTPSGLGALTGAATFAGALCKCGYLDKIKSALGFGAYKPPTGNPANPSIYGPDSTDFEMRPGQNLYYEDVNPNDMLPTRAKGGSIRSKKRVGCSSLRQYGGLPRK
jgi:hypothetical protein